MEGRHPGHGRWLRPEGAGGGRGGGIDVTFSAPKSVSVVWALGDPWQREQIEAAHARAVEQHRRVPTRAGAGRASPLRRPGRRGARPGRDRGRVPPHHRARRQRAHGRPTRSCTAMSSSRARSARTSGSSRSPRGRSSVARGSWARSTAPRSRTSWPGEGYEIERGTGKDGRYFEIAGVPRGLLDAFSAARVRSPGRPSGSVRATAARPSAASCATSRSRTAGRRPLTTRADLQRAWSETGRRARLRADEAVRLIGAPERSRRSSGQSRIASRTRLTEQHAVFDAGELRAVALEQTAGRAVTRAGAHGRQRDDPRPAGPPAGGRADDDAHRARSRAGDRAPRRAARRSRRPGRRRARPHDATREVAERIGGSPLSTSRSTRLQVTHRSRARARSSSAPPAPGRVS